MKHPVSQLLACKDKEEVCTTILLNLDVPPPQCRSRGRGEDEPGPTTMMTRAASASSMAWVHGLTQSSKQWGYTR
jgi:hypothetical protein